MIYILQLQTNLLLSCDWLFNLCISVQNVQTVKMLDTPFASKIMYSIINSGRSHCDGIKWVSEKYKNHEKT